MDVSDYPPLFVTADSASGWGQRWQRRIVGSNLLLIVVASIFGYIATLGGDALRIWAAIVSALVLVAGLTTRYHHKFLRDDRAWFEGRAVAETSKSLTWRYMMRVPPFGSDSDPDAAFLAALDEVNSEVPVASKSSDWVADARQITARMRENRTADLENHRTLYATIRLGDQVKWYESKTAYNKRRAALWSRVVLVGEVAAVISALAVVVSPNPWVNGVSLLGAFAAAATAWSQLGQHSELSISYGHAARELVMLAALATKAATEQELIAVVRSGEAAISREHTLWIAKRGTTLAPTV